MELLDFRKKYNKSQQEVADAIGVDVTTVCKYERKDIKPSLHAVHKIQVYTNGEVKVEDFIHAREKEN